MRPKDTGRIWVCPKCGNKQREGSIPLTIAPVCRRTLACRRTRHGATTMTPTDRAAAR